VCEKNDLQKSSKNHDLYVAKRFFDFHFFCLTMLEKTCAIDIVPFLTQLLQLIIPIAQFKIIGNVFGNLIFVLIAITHL
jgi:hypothetical protein